MNLSLRKRIALLYMLVTAILTGVLFITIYIVVYNTVYSHLDSDLDAESIEIYHNLVILSDRFTFANPEEFLEKEHRQIEVNPTFIQIYDNKGKVLRKTGNLLEGNLLYSPQILNKVYLNARLSGAPIRQVQSPVFNHMGNVLGFIVIAIPLEESALVLTNLRNVLIIAFPLVLFLLYVVTTLIAGKSIAPINKVINAAEKISRQNIDERIVLPFHKDEIYVLTSKINGLLDRLQDAVLREKQFTADASHELRTPLAVIKGTLEVLIRKPRSIEHYESKIKYCICEVDRMSEIVDQLLMLARFESGKLKPLMQNLGICEIIEGAIKRLEPVIKEKNINVIFTQNDVRDIFADHSMLNIIFDNIISNAVKYSSSGKEIEISAQMTDNRPECIIRDFGIGMTEEQKQKVFDRFYRVDESRNSSNSGVGLGLAIVKRLADLQNITLKIDSVLGVGTSFHIIF